MGKSDSKQQKSKLHPRNKNRERYDLGTLIRLLPELKAFVKLNKYGAESLDFANPKAVRLLNQALLKQNYGISYWSFPQLKLCPPIPGRADYIHYAADLLSASNGGKIPKGNQIKCLDIGVGASCIYPIIGQCEYGWQFIGSDIDANSLASAQKIVDNNPTLVAKIDLRLQASPNAFLEGIIKADEQIALTICNPPFHASKAEAQRGSQRKLKNLKGKQLNKPKLNFAGISHELIYEGGEKLFLQKMIKESKRFAKSCLWFTSLVSKEANLPAINKTLDRTQAAQVKIIPMNTGNKTTRIIAWTFLNKKEQSHWIKQRWNA